MFKKLLFSLFLIGIAKFSLAAPPVFENGITSCGTTISVTLSSSEYTELTTQDLAGRTGVFVVNYATNTINVFLDTGTTVGKRFAELEPGEWDVFPISNALQLYAISASGTPNVDVKECTNK